MNPKKIKKKKKKEKKGRKSRGLGDLEKLMDSDKVRGKITCMK